MAGIHNDPTTHRVVSGDPPRVGLRVITNDLKWGTIVKVATDEGCGYYCAAWHDVLVDGTEANGDGGRSQSFNCDRLSARDMLGGHPDPHPERGYMPEGPKRELRTITVTVEVAVDVEDYLQAYGDTSDIDAYATQTVLWAANEQLRRVGWGTVPGVPTED